MVTRRESQRVYAEGLHEPRNRKERREADAAFARRVKARARKRKVKAIKEGVAGVAAGTMMAAFLVYALFLAPDPTAEAKAQQAVELATFQAWNGQYYTEEDYEAMMQERERVLAQEKAADGSRVKEAEEWHSRYEAEQERIWNEHMDLVERGEEDY